MIVFTRSPEPGRVKTRLIPVLGADGAAALHRRLTEHTLQQLSPLRVLNGMQIEIHLDGESPDAGALSLFTDLRIVRQAAGDLGERLIVAFGACSEPTIAIGTDCPCLGTEHVRQAFELLGRYDLVLGPASDGGYYLVGLREPCPEVFRGIAWGTDQVFRQTQSVAQRLGLSVGILETLWDVDRPEDLLRLKGQFSDLFAS